MFNDGASLVSATTFRIIWSISQPGHWYYYTKTRFNMKSATCESKMPYAVVPLSYVINIRIHIGGSTKRCHDRVAQAVIVMHFLGQPGYVEKNRLIIPATLEVVDMV